MQIAVRLLPLLLGMAPCRGGCSRGRVISATGSFGSQKRACSVHVCPVLPLQREGCVAGKAAMGPASNRGCKRNRTSLSPSYPSLCSSSCFLGCSLFQSPLGSHWTPHAMERPPRRGRRAVGSHARPCPGCPGSNCAIDCRFDSCCFIYLLSNNLLNKTLLW